MDYPVMFTIVFPAAYRGMPLSNDAAQRADHLLTNPHIT